LTTLIESDLTNHYFLIIKAYNLTPIPKFRTLSLNHDYKFKSGYSCHILSFPNWGLIHYARQGTPYIPLISWAPFMVYISRQGDNHILCTKLVAILGSTSKSIFLTWEGSHLLYWTRGYTNQN